MKKQLLLSLVILLTVQISQAQLRIALSGGGHSASVNETNDLPNWSEMKSKYSSRTGVHFGFLADLQLGYQSKFYFQPGIIFYNKGRNFSNTYDTSIYNYFSIDQNQFINYIDAPLNLVYKHQVNENIKLFIGAGPYLSFFYNGKEKTETYLKSGSFKTEENTDLPVGNAPGKYSTFDFGVNGTTGIEFQKFFISLNYSKGLKDFYQATYSGQFKHQVLGGTIGVFLGKPVILNPKIKDRDKDGVPDNVDACENEAGPELTKGCPDRDGDGIADKEDKCPDEKGVVSNNGCPAKDSDADGVDDDMDQCKDVPGLAKYKGCPIPDTDKDGVNDEEDKCINIPGFARHKGCPIPDKDGDGLNDEEDKCPEVSGTKENNGCPDIEKKEELAKREVIEKVEYAAKKIQFEFTKSNLLPESKKVLDEVAAILLEDENLQILIEGHTSNDGIVQANIVLSIERAEAVKGYLIEKGIKKERITATGYGPSRPLNEGKNPAEKALNRRVEMKLNY